MICRIIPREVHYLYPYLEEILSVCSRVCISERTFFSTTNASNLCFYHWRWRELGYLFLGLDELQVPGNGWLSPVGLSSIRDSVGRRVSNWLINCVLVITPRLGFVDNLKKLLFIIFLISFSSEGCPSSFEDLLRTSCYFLKRNHSNRNRLEGRTFTLFP